MEAEIEGVGTLRNPVVSWEDAHGEPAERPVRELDEVETAQRGEAERQHLGRGPVRGGTHASLSLCREHCAFHPTEAGAACDSERFARPAVKKPTSAAIAATASPARLMDLSLVQFGSYIFGSGPSCPTSTE